MGNEDKNLYETYKEFVKSERDVNDQIASDNIDWYEDIIDSDHFDRNMFDSEASKEPYELKRSVFLNAFEHISAMNRALTLRKLDYKQYFDSRDEYFIYDNNEMDNALSFFNKVVMSKK